MEESRLLNQSNFMKVGIEALCT